MKRYTWIILSILIFNLPLHGQDKELPPVTGTIAITNVNIIPSPGQLIQNGTVVIKDGIIISVGQNASVPAGARIIKADTMYLYAGFILGMSHAGVKMPEKKETPKVKVPASPPDDVAGITPERNVLSYLDANNESLSELRKLGFTIAQTAPEGGMLPGKASLILLNGNSADDLILAPETALFATLDGASRMYPATKLGVMAKYRELYRQAEQAKAFRQQYSNEPIGRQRPFYDRTLEAFYPVIDKQIPITFKASSVLDAQRVMMLKNELGFNLVLTELKEGWDIIDKVKSSNTKVLFSLDFPEWKEEKKDSTKEASTTEYSQERKLLEERKEEFAKKYYGQMSLFQKSGIPFGFSTLDAKPKDIHGNFVKMVENGLSENDALAALTTNPASILGISKMAGTVENGKMANLVISTKPYFDKDAKVKYVMVEGKLFDYDIKDKKPADPKAKANAKGSWSYSTETSEGTVTGKLIITETDGVLSGTISNSLTGQTSTLKDVTLSGNNLSFSFTVEPGGETLNIEGLVKLSENSFEGILSGGGEAFPIEGTKDPEH